MSESLIPSVPYRAASKKPSDHHRIHAKLQMAAAANPARVYTLPPSPPAAASAEKPVAEHHPTASLGGDMPHLHASPRNRSDPNRALVIVSHSQAPADANSSSSPSSSMVPTMVQKSSSHDYSSSSISGSIATSGHVSGTYSNLPNYNPQKMSSAATTVLPQLVSALHRSGSEMTLVKRQLQNPLSSDEDVLLLPKADSMVSAGPKPLPQSAAGGVDTQLLSQRVTGYNREQHIRYLEQYIARQCNPQRPTEHRAESYCRVLDETCDMHPSLVNVFAGVKRLIRGLVQENHAQSAEFAKNVVAMRQQATEDAQELYETKFLKSLTEQRMAAKQCAKLSEELSTMRRDREEDLNRTKAEICRLIEKVERDDEEMASVRGLVASVFRLNNETERRVQQLQRLLAKHKIPVPPREELVDGDDDEPMYRPSRSKTSPTQPATAEEMPTKQTPLLIAAPPSPATGKRPPKLAKQTSFVDSVSGAVVSPRSTKGASKKVPFANKDRDEEEDDAASLNATANSAGLPLEFMMASKREMEQCRLSTQGLLVSCASETQSSYKLLVSSLQSENERLKAEVSKLKTTNLALEHYIHEKRFRKQEKENELSDDALIGNGRRELNADERRKLLWTRDGAPANGRKTTVPKLGLSPAVAVSLTPAPSETDTVSGFLTPRPVLPFEVQPVLGVDLKHSTARMVEELAAVGIHLKRQNEELHVRVRRLSTCVSWMDDMTLNVLADRDDSAFHPTASVAEWDNCYHFLRTHVHPYVPNMKWTSTFVSGFLYHFFENFYAIRDRARWERDNKMLAPRQFLPSERRFNALLRLDATTDELIESVTYVPVGYVVSQYVYEHLIQSNRYDGDLLQMSTVLASASVNATHRFHYRQCPLVLEAEMARVSHNLWFSALKYRHSEPICDLFVRVLEGQVPLEVFSISTQVMRALQNKICSFDGSRTGGVTFRQLSSAVFSLFSDHSTDVWRAGLLAVAQTLETKGIPLIGKVSLSDVVGFENRTVPRKVGFGGASGAAAGPPRLGGEGAAGADDDALQRSPSVGAPRGSGSQQVDLFGGPSPLLVNQASASLPTAPALAQGSNVLGGASLLMRFVRRAIVTRYLVVYRRVEEVCFPSVRESLAVKGMFLLRVSDALSLLRKEDERMRTAHAQLLADEKAEVHQKAATVEGAKQDGSAMEEQPGTSTDRATLGPVPMDLNLVATSLERMAYAPPPLDAQKKAILGVGTAVFELRQTHRSLLDEDDEIIAEQLSGPRAVLRPKLPTCLGDIVSIPALLERTPANLAENAERAFQAVPRLNMSVHFPSNDPAFRPDTLGGVAIGKRGKRDSSVRRRASKGKRSGAPIAVDPMALLVDDQELVEWYSFLTALHQTVLTLPDAALTMAVASGASNTVDAARQSSAMNNLPEPSP